MRNPRSSVVTAPNPVDSLPGTSHDASVRAHRAARGIRWLRDPLVQFLVIGVALFLVYGALNHGGSRPGSSYQIALTIDDVRQLQNTFAAQWQRAPSPEEMRSLEENRVREEVLYREALLLGLDKDDVIIKRRLAQKMQFLAEDVAAAHQSTTAELEAWYEKNSDRFALPSRVSFRHLYFSPDRRGERAHDDAMNALVEIGREPEGPKATTDLADRFMFQDHYADLTPKDLEREFGAQFASAVLKLQPGSWQGPVESGYGWHLVFVDSVIPGRIPAFEEVEEDVKGAWLSDQKRDAWQRAYEQMRAKYTVLLPVPAESQSAGATSVLTEIPAPSGEGPP